jgi:streptogramin lyase
VDTRTLSRHRAGHWLGVAAVVALLVGMAFAVLWPARPRPRPPAPVLVERWPVVVRTIAGGGAPGFADGTGPAARFSDPFGVAVDQAGNVFVSDAGDNNAIRRVGPDGATVCLFGGTVGFADGDGAHAAFHAPSGLALTPVGRLVIADTGNNAIRLVSVDGLVTTIAGDGTPGAGDGFGTAARFNGPIGVAAGADGSIYVADTYNDRIRKISAEGQVTTLAGGGGAGYRDGAATEALFDTPSGIAVNDDGVVFVADTGNNAIRRIAPGGEVTTFGLATTGVQGLEPGSGLYRPVGLAVSSGYLYATDGAGRVLIFSADGTGRTLAGGASGSADGPGAAAGFRSPTGIAADARGVAWVADSDNYLVRRLAPPHAAVPQLDIDLDQMPRLTPTTLRLPLLPWPLAPQNGWHEIAATLGEPRGSLGGDGRERLHTGIDVKGDVGEVVLAVRDETVQRPIATGPFGNVNEALRIGVMSYVHLRVGRDRRNKILDPARFSIVSDPLGTPIRVRVKRGARFHVGDPLGTVNRMAHVHLDLGPHGAEVNPLAFGLPEFQDTVPPEIPANGIDLYDEAGARLTVRLNRRLIVTGRVSIVAEAFDRVNGNAQNRRLGIYEIGYQVLLAAGTPAPGFEQPRMTMRFDRLPDAPDAPWRTYADGSGITVYGNRRTRFRYIVTNSVQGGDAYGAYLDATVLAPGDYNIRVIARDQSGNTATRDLPISIVGVRSKK